MKKKMNCSEMVLHASKHNVQKRMNLKQIFKE